MLWAALLIGLVFAEINFIQHRGFERNYLTVFIYSRNFGPAVKGSVPLPAFGLVLLKLNNVIRLTVYTGFFFAPVFYVTKKLYYFYSTTCLINLISCSFLLAHETKLRGLLKGNDVEPEIDAKRLLSSHCRILFVLNLLLPLIGIAMLHKMKGHRGLLLSSSHGNDKASDLKSKMKVMLAPPASLT